MQDLSCAKLGLCRWVDDFSRLQLHSRPPPEAWAADFAAQQQQQQNGAVGRSQSWGQIWDESGAADSADWASDFAAKAATVSQHALTILPTPAIWAALNHPEGSACDLTASVT